MHSNGNYAVRSHKLKFWKTMNANQWVCVCVCVRLKTVYRKKEEKSEPTERFGRRICQKCFCPARLFEFFITHIWIKCKDYKEMYNSFVLICLNYFKNIFGENRNKSYVHPRTSSDLSFGYEHFSTFHWSMFIITWSVLFKCFRIFALIAMSIKLQLRKKSKATTFAFKLHALLIKSENILLMPSARCREVGKWSACDYEWEKNVKSYTSEMQQKKRR